MFTVCYCTDMKIFLVSGSHSCYRHSSPASLSPAPSGSDQGKPRQRAAGCSWVGGYSLCNFDFDVAKLAIPFLI